MDNIKINKWFRTGAYGSYEEGVALFDKTGNVIAFIGDLGSLIETKGREAIISLYSSPCDTDDLLNTLIDTCGNRIGGDKELQIKLLNLMNPAIVSSFLDNRNQRGE